MRLIKPSHAIESMEQPMTNAIDVNGRTPLCGSPGTLMRHVCVARNQVGTVTEIRRLPARPSQRYGPASARFCAAGALGATSRAIVTANLRKRYFGGGKRNYVASGAPAESALDS